MARRTRSRSRQRVGISGWSLAIGAAVLGLTFVAGVLVGQLAPKPVRAYFDVDYEREPSATASIVAPVLEPEYTFPEQLAQAPERIEISRAPREVEPTEEEAAQVEAAQTGDVDTMDAPTRVLERDPVAEVAIAAAEPSERDNTAAPVVQRDPVVSDERPAPASPPSDASTARSAAPDTSDAVRAVTRDVVVDDTVAETEVLARTANLSGGDLSPRPRTVQRTEARESAAGEHFQASVTTEASFDDAELVRGALRSAGLQATVQNRADGRFDVVIRGHGGTSERDRQVALANRVLRTM